MLDGLERGERERSGLIARWGRWNALGDAAAVKAATAWRAYLGVNQVVCLERISRFQVTDHHGRCGHTLVGVVYDTHTACIYHTRALTTEDLVHELLHVAYPSWSEAEVVAETHRLLTPVPGAGAGETIARGEGLRPERRPHAPHSASERLMPPASSSATEGSAPRATRRRTSRSASGAPR